MSHEIGQLDIPDPRLWTNSASSRASVWTEIGEAQITHTLFGRAKVRIIRKHDKLRRALWLTAMAAAAVLAATVWQTWFAAQQVVEPQSTESASPADAIESAPPSQSEAVPPTVAEPVAHSDQFAPAPAAPSPQSVAQQAPGLQDRTPQAPMKSAPPTTSTAVPKSQAGTPPPPVGSTPSKGPVAAVAATPRVASPPATASQPEIPALLNPVGQESVPPQSPAADGPAIEPAGGQP